MNQFPGDVRLEYDAMSQTPGDLSAVLLIGNLIPRRRLQLALGVNSGKT